MLLRSRSQGQLLSGAAISHHQYFGDTVHLQIGAGAQMLRPFYCTGTDDQNIFWYWQGTPKQISVAELKAANIDDMQS